MPVNEKEVVWCGRYSENLIVEIQKLHKSSQFCDVTLKAQNVEFEAHKIILAANSQYFKSLFTSGKGTGRSHYNLHSSVKVEPLRTILEYFYSGKLELSFDTVEDVLKLAKFFKVETIEQFCLEYLLISLDEDNCMQCLHMAEKYGWTDLRTAAEELILGGDLEMFQKEGFLRLTQEQITKILKSNTNVEKAESLFNAIVKWVEYDEENREDLLFELLQLLPKSGLSNTFRTSMMSSNETVRKNAKTLQWLIDSVLPYISLMTLLEKYVVSPEKSFFVASNDYGTNPCFQVKPSNPSQLINLPDVPDIDFFSPVCYKKEIYALFGTIDEVCYKLDNTTKTWTELDFDIDFQRFNAGTVVLYDTLYVIGGVTRNPFSTKHSRYRSCRSFDFPSHVKSNLPPMKEKRMMPGVAVHENSIYAAGGRFSSNTIERFDPREGVWYTVGQLDKGPNVTTSTVIKDTLYSCLLETGKMEAFDLRTYQLKEICDPTEDFAYITSLDDELYACLSNKIVRYDPSNNNWNDFCSNFEICNPRIVTWYE